VKFQSCHVPKAVFGVQVVLNIGLQSEKVWAETLETAVAASTSAAVLKKVAISFVQKAETLCEMRSSVVETLGLMVVIFSNE
jgi:hypothetical protein